MKNEQRPVVIQTFHYACLQKLPFDEAVASLIEMCNNIPIEGLKMAAAITSTERYCFKFQLDKCTNNVIGQDNFSSWKNGMCSFVVGNSTKQFSSITENQNRELVLTDPGPAVDSKLSPQYVTHSDNM